MAKKAILDVLESTIGKYVKNLDSESLNVAVWNGQIELNSLELNIAAVNAELDRQAAEAPNLALPFRVSGGRFDSLKIDVPWARITSRSVVFRAKGLKIILEPCHRKSGDPLKSTLSEEKRLEKLGEDRINSIKLYDDYRRQANALKKLAEVADDPESADQGSFSARLVRRIVENLQVEIEDVHICFRNHACSAGVVLQSLSLVTTDQHGSRTFVDRTLSGKDSFLNKVLQINGFGLYLDENTAFAISEENSQSTDAHSFILQPLSFEAKLRQSDNLQCIDFPKYLLSSELSRLSIVLLRSQLEQIHRISKSVAPKNGAQPIFAEYRPLSRISQKTVKVWWQYAFRCIQRLKGKSLWVEFFAAFQKRKEYIPLYKRHTNAETSKWMTALSDDEKIRLKDIESDRSISMDGLMAWRSIADAQADLERSKQGNRQKKASAGYLSSFFGSSGSKTTDDADDPPITLTIEEMKELEAISLEQSEDFELSNDSWLCDLSFVLGAFQIDLCNASRPMTTLKMGTVNTSFNANADGSYKFDFALSSLGVHDLVTQKTLFPMVLRNLANATSKALELRYGKTKIGDQDLRLSMVAFEMVASPLLVVEVKKFFSLGDDEASTKNPQNPMLRESLSGSVDLFFDADSGQASMIEGKESLLLDGDAQPTFSDQLSNALTEAWKSKTKEKSSWTIDCDIQAPVLIVPESCSHYESTVLVFDLGHVDIAYGNKRRATPQVLEWVKGQQQSEEASLDVGNISIDNLGFSVGKAKHILTASGDVSVKDHLHKTKPVLEPVSATLNCGILAVPHEASARLSFFGAFPSLSLRASPQQVSDSLTVINVWSQLAAKLGLDSQDSGDQEASVVILDDDEEPSKRSSSAQEPGSNEPESEAGKSGEGTKLYFMIRLERLSLYLDREQGDGVEAHLVSASASLSQMADGAIQSRLCMGWFWILDMLESPTPRRQRLLAHSTLPRSADELSLGGKYNIFEDIEQVVSSADHKATSGLADVRFWSPGQVTRTASDPFASSQPFDEEQHHGPLLKAAFASLYVHWNPRAIIILTSALQEIAESATTKGRQEVLLSPLSPSSRVNPRSASFKSPIADAATKTGPLLVKATMAKFEVLLNSAIDDLPLYCLTMSDTSVSMASAQSDLRLDLELGDLRVATPLSSVNESYRTILGLSANSSSSLLSVKYYDGNRALQSRSGKDDKTGFDNVETYAEIVISPMRFVYLQAQVMTLVDYVNDGILGALAAQAASKAANAALELAASGNQGNKIFALKAVGFDMILPESAISDRFFLLRTSDMSVRYTGFPHPGGATALVSLGEVLLSDESSVSVVEDPLHATIDVKLRPEGIGTLDEQAMRVNVQISRASFLLSKEHYSQIMLTLEGNISEQNSYLRSLASSDSVDMATPGSEFCADDADERPASVETYQAMTHAGVEFVIKQSRMYVTLKMDAMSLETFKVGRADSLVRVEAVRMVVGMDFIPDQQQTTMRVALHNLTCQDKRQQSSGRQFTYLFDRASVGADEKEVFEVTYVKDENTRRTNVEMRIGSPRIIVIPDVVADLLDFVSISNQGKRQSIDESRHSKGENRVQVLDGAESIEATYSLEAQTFFVSLSASNCQVVLVDLGSSSSSATDSRATAESIVFQGSVDCTYLQESETETGVERATDLEIHGVGCEAYTAYGFDLTRPLQILEPTSFSLFYNLRNTEGRSPEIEIRAVTLSDVDMTFSMQNVALLEVIASGLTESTEKREASSWPQDSHVPLSEEEVKRISELASALVSADDSSKTDKSFVHQSSVADDASSLSSKETAPDTPRFHWKVRLTLPKVVVTVVNDLQGLDEPLLRIGSSNVVIGGEVRMGMHLSKIEPMFDAHVNCTLTADYFNPSINLWQQLLSKPWEVTFKTARGVSQRYRTNRLSTTIDLEAFPCYISFSEQFLASLNGANRMWSTYSKAIDSAVEQTLHKSELKRKALAASATRKMITSLPYGVENATGIDIHFSVEEDGETVRRRLCRPGLIQYFRFEPPRGNGYGGRRLYGQEVTQPKRLKLYIEERTITIDHIDGELGRPRKIHKFDDGLIVITYLRKEAKSMVLRLGSQVDLINQTTIPFQVSVSCRESKKDLGVCEGNSKRQSPLSLIGDEIMENSRAIGLPIDMLRKFEHDIMKPVITISPMIPNTDLKSKLTGEIIVPSCMELLALIESGSTELVVDTICTAQRDESTTASLSDPFVVLVRIKMTTVDDIHPFVDISLEPRATLRNSMPVSLLVKTPMPHTFSSSFGRDVQECIGYENIHTLAPTEFLEVFTPGPSFAVSMKCADHPISGGTTDWMKGNWVDLPMVREFRLPEPIMCEFPFAERQDTTETGLQNDVGIPFFVVENREDLTEATFEHSDKTESSFEQEDSSLHRSHSLEVNESANPRTADAMRSYLLTVCNYGVDHTGSILFEQVSLSNASGSNPRDSILRQSLTSSKMITSSPFSAYASTKGDLRISLLPSSRSLIRILRLTIEGENGLQRSQLFRVEDVSICDGGLESSPIKWEDGSKTGYYMYRVLIDSYQSEIHVIPEFVVYNGSSNHRVIIRQIGAEILIEPGKMARVEPHAKMGLVFTLDYLDFAGRAGPLKVDDLKHQLAMIKSLDGQPLGSVAVQTVIGGRDSRLVVKLGEVKFGEMSKSLTPAKSMFERDLVRMRVRWSELQITLCETIYSSAEHGSHPFLDAVVERMIKPHTTKSKSDGLQDSEAKTKDPVCTICLRQFTVDWQRIFKDEDTGNRQSMNKLHSPERSQLSLIIHNIQVLDKTPNTKYPVVFNSTSDKISFVDLCIRTRGALDADLVKIDLVDLNLAHVKGVSDKIVVKTSEEFVWKLLDITDRILQEATAISGIDIALEWDETEGDYRVSVLEGEKKDNRTEYTAPPSDRLIAVNKARVSPFAMEVSFQRRPQASRYKLVRDISGANLVNYFTTRLKFTLDKADLKFARYEGHNIKGPPSRLFEIVSAVYVSRMKLKVVSILSAANFQDWKYLSARDGGDDEFVEGDVLRVTGNLVGKSANYILKTMGHGLGGGLTSMTKSFGDGIESASDKVGARAVGAGVNSVVSGLGAGIGGTVSGVGTGAGKVLKGAGKGVGQLVGGLTGGVLIAGKGIGKGVSSGDGKAVISGFTEGAASIGSGVGQGVESAVMGTADGILSVGQGLFSGVKSIGKGFGGVFKSPPNKSSKR